MNKMLSILPKDRKKGETQRSKKVVLFFVVYETFKI